MSLNINNPETHALAAELAERLGSTLTEAVTIALRDRLALERRGAVIAERKEKITRSARRIADMIGPEGLVDHHALLYEDRGMPLLFKGDDFRHTDLDSAIGKEQDVYE